MLVTLSGIVMLARPVHHSNAAYPILVTPFGTAYDVSDFPSGYRMTVVLSLLSKIPFSELYAELPSATFIFIRSPQKEKATFPILVTVSGMVTAVRQAQPRKAESPMLVTPSGMMMLLRFLQSAKAELPIFFTPSGITTSVSPGSAMYFFKTPFLIFKLMIFLLILFNFRYMSPAVV